MQRSYPDWGCNMAKKILSLLFFSLTLGASCGHLLAEGLDRETLESKKGALLEYLKSVALSDKYLSGQRMNSTEGHLREWKWLLSNTGRLPAIMCAEYCTGSGTKNFPDAEAAIQWRRMNAFILEHWERGGLITITFHFPNPYNENFSGLRQKVRDGGAAICSESSPVRLRWLALLDEVAKGVKDLNSKGVVPELRPLHESNGKWFWWGAYLPKDVQQKLEDDFLDPIESAGCVVIWHKSWGMVDGDRIFKPERYDIIGYDVYQKKAWNLSCISKLYKEVLQMGKIFQLSEFGTHLGKSASSRNTYECSDIISGMDKYCPRSCASVWWAGPEGIHNANGAREYMNNPRIITLGGVSYKGR